jgi:hypothetical protein
MNIGEFDFFSKICYTKRKWIERNIIKMKIDKENNQYYGQFIEEAINSIINQTEIKNTTNFFFTDEEIEEMTQDAKDIAREAQGHRSVYVGRNTGKENCDLIVDGREIEIKYVSLGNGTYLNTSVNYFHNRFGFTDFKEYTSKELLPFLEKYYGESVYKNLSPVSMEQSKEIRHNNPDLYRQIQQIDKVMRKEYVSDLYNFFCNNLDKLQIFISDMINKNIGNKRLFDEMIVFNHSTKQIKHYSKEFLQKYIQNKKFKNTGLGMSFDGFRIQIGWQNGSGLNNPTLRVFIKE